MKRILMTILMVTLAASLILTGCSGQDESGTPAKAPDAAGSSDETEKMEKIVVGLDDNFPPMGFLDEKGEIVGFDIDMAKEAAKRMGVEVVFQPINWESKELELNSKNIDLIWNGLTITPKRQEQMGFTKPYLEDKQIIVVVKGSEIKGKTDLAGKIIGLQAGSSSKEALEADQETLKSLENIVEYPNNNEALIDLKIGRTDAVVVDEVVGRHYIAKKPDDYVILEDNFGVQEFGVGLRKEDTQLLNELQKVLDEMKEDGTSARISKEWFGEDIVK